MTKLAMETNDGASLNINKLAQLFPNVVTEKKDKDGKLVKSVNFDALRDVLTRVSSVNLSEGREEYYEFSWPGKRKAKFEAAKAIRKTLRPNVESSINWNSTKNLYIEGDNLEALKLLREAYLEKIKMIYIDPPYNTGKDFVYKDSFKTTSVDLFESAGAVDEYGERMITNLETNGRFHSDWCSMIYPRLLVARDLLAENGVMFISIDDNEVTNMRNICDEVFGEDNFVSCIIWERAFSPKNDAKFVSNSHDYVLIYAKDICKFEIGQLERTAKQNNKYKNPDNDPRGVWTSGDLTVKTYSKNYDYSITTPSGRTVLPSNGSCWRVNKERFSELVEDNRIWFGSEGNNVPRIKRFLSEIKDGITPTSIWFHEEVGHNQEARQEIKRIFSGKGLFDGPKPVRLLEKCLKLANLNGNDIVLDFFSGSATTAHAVVKSNLAKNQKNRYILVQLPETLKDASNAKQLGYNNICDIALERMRLVGESLSNHEDLDVGFRVFHIDSSNMQDVFYSASDTLQALLDKSADNIKNDRSELDLLYGCLVDWGVELSLPYKREVINSHTVHCVGDNTLIACFDKNVSSELFEEIAKLKPIRLVLRDHCFNGSGEKCNALEILKKLAPNTDVKVL